MEVMVPQHHPLGEETEVDFGTASVWLAGALGEVSVFVIRLSVPRRRRPGLPTLRWSAPVHPLRQP